MGGLVRNCNQLDETAVRIEHKPGNGNYFTVLLVTVGLVDMQLPCGSVMQVTGHKNEAQMRRDYHIGVPDESYRVFLLVGGPQKTL